MRDHPPEARILLTAAIAVLAAGCGGGSGGGIFSDPGDQVSLTHANPSTTTGMVTGIAIAQIDVEAETSTQRTLSLALSGTDAHYFLTHPEQDENAAPDPATITFAGSETRSVYVAILCVHSGEPRPVTLRVSDSLGTNEVTIDDYQCDPPDIQFSTEQNMDGASDPEPTIITPDHINRYAYRHYPITTSLPRPPPGVFNLDPPETVDIEVLATPEDATQTQQITVWRAPYDPAAAERSTTPRTALSIQFERQDAQRAAVHWSCPEAPGEHTLRGTVHARLASARFEWESDRVEYHQVCQPPLPPVIELLPPGQPPRARISEQAEGQFRIVNQSPIPRQFTVEITPSNDAPFHIDVPGNRSSPSLPYAVACSLDDLNPAVAIKVGDAFTEGIEEPPTKTTRAQCAGLPLSVFPRTLNLRTPPIPPIEAGGFPVIAAQQFSVVNHARPAQGGRDPELTMNFNHGECDPKAGACVWTEDEWNDICRELPCTINAFDSRTPSPEHDLPAGQVTKLVMTAPCGAQTPPGTHSVPIATRLDGEPVPDEHDLPPLLASVSCEGQVTTPDDIRIDGPRNIEAKGWEHAQGFVHIANESRAAITPTVNITGPGEFLNGRTTTTLRAIQPQGTQTLEYRAPCPDRANYPTVYDIQLSLLDPPKDYDVTLTCTPAALSVSLPLPNLYYEPPVEVRDLAQNPQNIRIDRNSLRLDAYAWGQFQVAAHLDASKLIPQSDDAQDVTWHWSQVQTASDLRIINQEAWTEWRNAASQHRVAVNDFLNSVENLTVRPNTDELPLCHPGRPLRPLEPCVPTRPNPPEGLESSSTEDSGQRNLYIYWSCPDPNLANQEVAEERGTLAIHASKGDLRSRPFNQTIRKACEVAAPLDLINQFLVHQGLVVRHDHAPGPIQPLRGLPRRLSVEVHYPSRWTDWELRSDTLSVTQTVGQQPSPATPTVELGPREFVNFLLPDLNVRKGVAIYAIEEPAENRDLTIGVQFHNVPAPPHSGSEADRYDTEQVFRIPRPRVAERIHRPIHVLWGVSPSISEVQQAIFLADLARRVPLVHSAGSTFDGSPRDGSAHSLLRDFATHAGHPADWVFVPIAPDTRSPDEWPVSAHEGGNTAGVHYARVALVPDPRVGQRQGSGWLDYANDLDAWSYAAARWLDAGEPSYPAVTWLNLISDGREGTSPVQAFFRPDDAHDINDRSADTAMSMGVPSVPTWNRMVAHLAREPARASQDDPSSLSHVLVASLTEPDSTFQLSLDQEEARPDWGASPRRSGGNRYWRVVYFTGPSSGNAALETVCDGSPPPSTASVRRHQIDVPLTTFSGLPTEATGIAWRLPLPDNAGECDSMDTSCPIRQVHIQTDPGDSGSWQCRRTSDDPFPSS